MLAKAPKKDSFPARAGHLVSSDAPTNLHGNPLHRRSLSGILARSGTKNSALTRAERKNRQKKVPFKDAVNALHPEDRPGCIQTTLAQYMSEEEQLYPKELELILQTLSLQTEETVMQAAHYLLQRNFFFSLIKVTCSALHIMSVDSSRSDWQTNKTNSCSWSIWFYRWQYSGFLYKWQFSPKSSEGLETLPGDEWWFLDRIFTVMDLESNRSGPLC